VSDGVSVSAAERIALRRHMFGYFTDHELHAVRAVRHVEAFLLLPVGRFAAYCAEHDRQPQKR
jgi:hypothetical protein